MAKKKIEDPLYSVGDILYSDFDKENIVVTGFHDNPLLNYNSYKVVLHLNRERMKIPFYTRSEDELHKI